MTIEKRVDRVTFKISGPDATHLLHDVLTPPVLEDGEARWFALLAPQGKLLAEGLIGWADGAHWLDVPAAVTENFFKRMKMYRLRAKMDIEMLAETHAVGWSAEAPETGIVHRDGRGEGLGYRVIAALADAEDWAEGTGQAKARIAAGIAEMGPDFATEEVFPHDIGMDHLGGVDFKKGCYVGQEVVSRMQHRGTARRRPVIVSGIVAGARGDAVVIGGKSVGTLGGVVGGTSVAIARIDKITDGGAASVAGAPVSLALPQWARYDFATPGGDSEDD
ncbi:MAG TPA: folate-binding protein YgfZ [Pelagibacterium sp.]|uniref:CAF17-like 4Fe-4S cluster assembly/insertion protein YgfZ n=1 Tax=uncultured Pelagibacterium sp. TaxID=1159875 RepID=UPI000EC45C1E|nr:folate-binding protein YgfZ [Pelagibacterium sp.]|tara:strand:- start:11626 stop:12456 length:831 start_codon:yes stop_codon:yes gene_type:complete